MRNKADIEAKIKELEKNIDYHLNRIKGVNTYGIPLAEEAVSKIYDANLVISWLRWTLEK